MFMKLLYDNSNFCILIYLTSNKATVNSLIFMYINFSFYQENLNFHGYLISLVFWKSVYQPVGKLYAAEHLKSCFTSTQLTKENESPPVETCLFSSIGCFNIYQNMGNFIVYTLKWKITSHHRLNFLFLEILL